MGHFHSELGFVYWEFDMAEGYLGLGFYLGTDHILYCLLDQEAEVLGGLESPIVDWSENLYGGFNGNLAWKTGNDPLA